MSDCTTLIVYSTTDNKGVNEYSRTPSQYAVGVQAGPDQHRRRFFISEKATTRAFSWLKVATTAFTLKNLLRHYAKQALTPRSLNVKLGPRRNYHKGRAAIRHYANQPARPF